MYRGLVLGEKWTSIWKKSEKEGVFSISYKEFKNDDH